MIPLGDLLLSLFNKILGKAKVASEQSKEWLDRLTAKLDSYKDVTQGREWLEKHYDRVKLFFTDYKLRDFIFEPFKDVFKTPKKTIDADIYSVITQVAVVNAVLAGLPGKMGIGVYITMALEAWMAYSIARHVGLKIDKPSDVWKYFGILAATVGIILEGFRVLLGIAFSLFSFVPEVNPLIFAELLVTDIVGVLFWVGFKEAKETGSFSVPSRLLKTVWVQSKSIFDYQIGILKNTLSIENIKLVYQRIRAYLSGEIATDVKQVNGETFATAAMAFLLTGQEDKLQGPLGEAFLEAVRLRWSSQFDENITIEQMAERFREYDSDQLDGVFNTIKGKMFEILVTKQENSDGDEWYAKMHTDESFPGSDIIFTNIETGDQLEVSLKAVADTSTDIIERALAKYPELPIMSTDEVAAFYENDDRVFGGGFTNEDLQNITEEKFDELVDSIEVSAEGVVIGGVSMGTIAALWPFFIAYKREKITYQQFEKAYKKVLGDAGVRLASRMSYAVVFGPIFAWYLLARGVKGIVVMAEPSKGQIYRVEYFPASYKYQTAN